jgi:hypothetical protein
MMDAGRFAVPAREIADGSMFDVETGFDSGVSTSFETRGGVICVIFDGETVFDPGISTSLEIGGVVI